MFVADRSKSNLFSSCCIRRVWRRMDQDNSDRFTKAAIKQGGGGFILWGCISVIGLIFTKNNGFEALLCHIAQQGVEKHPGIGNNSIFPHHKYPKYIPKITTPDTKVKILTSRPYVGYFEKES